MIIELALLNVKESIPLCKSVEEDQWKTFKESDPRLSLNSMCMDNNSNILMQCIHGQDLLNYSPKREMNAQPLEPKKGPMLSMDCGQTAQAPVGCNLTPYSTVVMMPSYNLEMLTT